MKWKKDTAADVVMGAAAKIAEDMVHGTAAAIEQISRYHYMYRSMGIELTKTADNLKRHMLGKKWMSKDDRKKLRGQISQIRAMAKICGKMQMWCTGFATGTITELRKFESNKKLSEIVKNIETEMKDEDEEEDK